MQFMGAWAVYKSVPDAFASAMDDDFGTSAALASLHDTVREGNAAIDSGNHEAVRATFGAVFAMTEALGINVALPQWADRGGDRKRVAALHEVVDVLVTGQLAARQHARADKDFTTADAIRDSLAAAGIAIDDTAEGARWSLLEEN
jgi:cysteinyl-tRNA synthetase